MMLTQSAYARRVGVSRQYISQLIAQGLIPRRADGRIDSDAADEALEQNRPHPLRVE